MSFDKRLLDILCCPVSKVPVKLLPADKLRQVNALIRDRKLTCVDERVVEAELEAALITDDNRTIYPIEAGIPIMLEEQGIPAEQIPGFR